MSRSLHLTTAILRKKVAKRTGLPERIVGQVIDVCIQEMQEELIQQGTVKLRGFVSISTSVKRLGGSMGVEGRRILLTIRPIRSFRKALNRVPLG